MSVGIHFNLVVFSHTVYVLIIILVALQLARSCPLKGVACGVVLVHEQYFSGRTVKVEHVVPGIAHAPHGGVVEIGPCLAELRFRLPLWLRGGCLGRMVPLVHAARHVRRITRIAVVIVGIVFLP